MPTPTSSRLSVPVRRLLTVFHRWAGLFIAGFLVVSGVTGAIISWDHEIDEWLNSHLTASRAQGPAQDPMRLAAEIERRHPQVRVTGIPLALEEGHSYEFGVQPRLNPANGELFEPGYNQVFIDPASSEELGTREWGAVWPLSAENFISFMYVLHYSLHLPEFWGIDHWGLWLMGIVALIWTVDCFTGFALTLPPVPPSAGTENPRSGMGSRVGAWWRRWMPAWKIRTNAGAYRLNFDVHRACGLWTWALLFIIAFTAFSMNLSDEVFRPAMLLVSDVTPSPYDKLPHPTKYTIVEPQLTWEQALARGREEADRRGWSAPAGSVSYDTGYGVYGISFFRPGDADSGGVGFPYLGIDGRDGRLFDVYEPWKGTTADLFVQAQFPLHSGRILGIPGRILISIMGLVVAALSVTGVVIWWRKRSVRIAALARLGDGDTHRPDASDGAGHRPAVPSFAPRTSQTYQCTGDPGVAV